MVGGFPGFSVSVPVELVMVSISLLLGCAEDSFHLYAFPFSLFSLLSPPLWRLICFHGTSVLFFHDHFFFHLNLPLAFLSHLLCVFSPPLLFFSHQSLQGMLSSLHSELDIQRYLMKIQLPHTVSQPFYFILSASCHCVRKCVCVCVCARACVAMFASSLTSAVLPQCHLAAARFNQFWP